jgi:hypothetical protein
MHLPCLRMLLAISSCRRSCRTSQGVHVRFLNTVDNVRNKIRIDLHLDAFHNEVNSSVKLYLNAYIRPLVCE